MIRPYAECPSFERCSANVCPLDPLSGEKERLPGEDKCKAHKPTRIKIGSRYPELLKYKGLTSKESQGIERWANLSPEKKALVTERLSKSLKLAKSAINKGITQGKEQADVPFTQ